MGYLFENAADMNIQTARKERDEAKKMLDEAERKADEAIDKLSRMITAFIAHARKNGKTKEEIYTELQTIYCLTENEVDQYWK